jgi:hypothetical protein
MKFIVCLLTLIVSFNASAQVFDFDIQTGDFADANQAVYANIKMLHVPETYSFNIFLKATDAVILKDKKITVPSNSSLMVPFEFSFNKKIKEGKINVLVRYFGGQKDKTVYVYGFKDEYHFSEESLEDAQRKALESQSFRNVDYVREIEQK